MTYEKFVADVWRRVALTLEQGLKPKLRHAKSDDMVGACCRRLEHTDLSPKNLKRKFDELPEDPGQGEAWFDKWLAPICQRIGDVWPRVFLKLEERLQPRLQHANLTDVIELCCRQLEHTGLSAQMVKQKLDELSEDPS